MIGIELLGQAEFDAKIALITKNAENLDGALLEAGKIIETSCKSFCPVDTGRLRSSILAESTGKNSVQVAPHTDYAQYVEFGTYKMGAQPYMKPGYEAAREAALAHIKGKITLG